MSEPNCLVCNLQPGGNYDHYGCKGICSSCRNFFKRSVQSQSFRDFKCRNKDAIPNLMEECKIDSLNRTSCKKCRFDKCIKVGMKTGYVKTKHRGLEIPAINTLCKNPTLRFTIEEDGLSKHMKSLFLETVCTKHFEFVKEDVETYRYWINLRLEGRILPFELIKTLELNDTIVMTDVALKFLSLQDELTGVDKFFLIKSNVKKLIGFLWAVFNERIDLIDFIHNLISYGQLHQDTIAVEAILPVIQNIQMNNSSGIRGYDVVYSTPWAPHYDIEISHSELSKAISRWARPSPEELPDPVQLVFITMIILLSCDSTEFPSPKQKSKIENLQLRFILMYQRYLKQIFPKEANARLAGGIMLLQHAGELYEMHAQRLPI